MTERWWSRTRQTPEPAPGNPCPICQHIASRWQDTVVPVGEVTHGFGDPERDYGMCWEHYIAITAHRWLDSTDGYPTPTERRP